MEAGISMSALGQKQTYALHQLVSALPPIATAKADSYKRSCPLCPRKRTCAVQEAKSAKGHKRTLSDLVNDLVRHKLIGQIDWIKFIGLTVRQQLCSLLHQRSPPRQRHRRSRARQCRLYSDCPT